MGHIMQSKTQRVLDYFYEICKIPHGSGDMEKIADYCVCFAEKHQLRYIKDNANNVVIYKNATSGYENAEPIILQGHLDMVCQKTADSKIDFLKDGIEIYTDGDFLKADGTTLGADNGIAVAMILAILESDKFAHPEIQAVFTTDEEIGMVGASALDTSLLTAKRMINLDSEEDAVVSVSCAGGIDVKATLPFETHQQAGECVKIKFEGLLGGHSGVDINKNRYNANVLAGRFLFGMKRLCDYSIISIFGGDKANAITNNCEITLCVDNAEKFIAFADDYLNEIKSEIFSSEPKFDFSVSKTEVGDFLVIDKISADKLIFFLCCAPNGVIQMSAEIENLVETSLNLGVLKTNNDNISFHFALRSNKGVGLNGLRQKLECFCENIDLPYETGGFYPPWEYKADSELREIYKSTYEELFGITPKCEAIHAGLECAVFASKIDGIDCIAIGPTLYDVHTVNECAEISSINRTYELLLEILERCK